MCVRYDKIERHRVEIATRASQAVTKTVNKRHQQEVLDMLGQQAEGDEIPGAHTNGEIPSKAGNMAQKPQCSTADQGEGTGTKGDG